MDRLNTVSVVVEWAARLAAPALCFLMAVASAVTAAVNLGHGRMTVTVIMALLAAVSCLIASILAAKAIRRLRAGPPAPPGESL